MKSAKIWYTCEAVQAHLSTAWLFDDGYKAVMDIEGIQVTTIHFSLRAGEAHYVFNSVFESRKQADKSLLPGPDHLINDFYESDYRCDEIVFEKAACFACENLKSDMDVLFVYQMIESGETIESWNEIYIAAIDMDAGTSLPLEHIDCDLPQIEINQIAIQELSRILNKAGLSTQQILVFIAIPQIKGSNK